MSDQIMVSLCGGPVDGEIIWRAPLCPLEKICIPVRRNSVAVWVEEDEPMPDFKSWWEAEYEATAPNILEFNGIR